MIPSKLKTDAFVSPPATFSLLLPILQKSRPHQFTNNLHFAPSFPSNASCRWHHLTLLAPRSSSSSSDSPPASSAELLELDFDAELSRFMAILPNQMKQRLRDHAELYQLIEVVMDLGRQPLARFPSGDFILADCPITFQDLQHATTRVGDFDSDNRAGISRTLHRISAIKNRKGAIIGLTCRIGRAISGSASLLRDLIQHGASLLMIGPPGVGKTTIIRELARILANDFKKRVMVIDTSNEIGGDGDIPHAGIGNARRMQVPTSDMQHKVLIEAVENHMPQVIVIDEIGTKLEAMAASTIAQRGIQLVATAHGLKIENLILNPTLEMLVGGVQSVTLGDEEAGRRRMQKTVLERKGPSTFISAVEIVSKTELRIHHNLEATVDSILSGRSPYVEVRKVKTSKLGETTSQISPSNINNYLDSNLQEMSPGKMGRDDLISEFPSSTKEISCKNGAPFLLFVYGIPVESAKEGVRQLKLDDAVQLTDNISEADALLALQSKIKKNSGIQAVAKSRDIPIYVTKTTSLIQISKAIQALVNDHADDFKGVEFVRKMNLSENIDALEEARIAIEQVVIPRGEPVELLPRPPQILSLQMDLARKYQLQAETIGTELDEHICILPLLITPEKDQRTIETFDTKNVSEDLTSTDTRKNGLPFSAIKLPFLPE